MNEISSIFSWEWSKIIQSVASIITVVFAYKALTIWKQKALLKHEYDLKVLEAQRQKEIRLKSEVVSELLAQWIRKNGKLDYHELNKLSFQAFIWLPKDIAKELSDSLAHKDGAQDVRVIIKNIRTYLQGTDDGFKSKDVIVFNEPDIKPNK